MKSDVLFGKIPISQTTLIEYLDILKEFINMRVTKLLLYELVLWMRCNRMERRCSKILYSLKYYFTNGVFEGATNFQHHCTATS